MSRRNLLISLLSIILILSLGSFYYFYVTKEENSATNDKNKITYPAKETPDTPTIENELKYYIVYIKRENGSGSSFVPLNLNPSFKNDSEFHVSLSFDDNGDIINGDKVIQIDNYVISEQNKEEIRKIAGVEKFDIALKEIEDRVNETKERLKK